MLSGTEMIRISLLPCDSRVLSAVKVFVEQYKLLSFQLCNSIESLIASSGVEKNVLVCILFSDSVSLFSTHKVRNYFPRP